ncbi:MAG: hypothetical protein CMI09_00555 [Oceanospirillaceae bacterium]|nr:hypothetical protein [Oceanospirillaceae bacterium]
MKNDDTHNNAAATESKQLTKCKRKPTQKQQVLKHLQESGSGLTQAEAANLYNCWRLAPCICRLRKEGHIIDTIEEPNRQRTGTHARYILITEPTPPTAA